MQSTVAHRAIGNGLNMCLLVLGRRKATKSCGDRTVTDCISHLLQPDHFWAHNGSHPQQSGLSMTSSRKYCAKPSTVWSCRTTAAFSVSRVMRFVSARSWRAAVTIASG